MSERTFVIRDATIDDVVEIGSLGRKLYRTYFAHLWSEDGFTRFVNAEFEEASIHRDIADRQASYYLLELDGATIGFAKTKPEQEIPQSTYRGTLLEKLYFLPEHTSSGLGQIVLADLVARAEADGAEWMWLEVLKTNERAQRAYEKAGFTISGEVPFSTDQQEIGFFIMWRNLRRDGQGN